MEESMAKFERSVAPMIFIIVVALHFLSRYLEINKKKGSTSSEDMQLRAEIKQLLKEASALSQYQTNNNLRMGSFLQVDMPPFSPSLPEPASFLSPELV